MSLASEEAAAVVVVPRVSLTEVEGGDHQHCLVCYSELTHPGILPCNHNEICGVCHLRLRFLHGNKKCPICKEEHEKIISDHPGKTYDEYPMWGDDLGKNYVLQKDVGIFFPTDHYTSGIEPLFGYQCKEAHCPYDGTVPDPNMYEQMQEDAEANTTDKAKNKKPPTPLRALQDHLRVRHRLTLCQLCIDHKRDFVALLPRMAQYQLKKHLTKGDGPGSGFEGHPVCEFCRPKRFYDLTHLHLHLQKEHYKCHVCEKQGLQNQYFRNYQSLEKHFDKAHFMCHDVQCMQARFVVFENDIDLQAHERHVHGGSGAGGSTKIQLEFRTRRSGYDGSGLDQQQPRQDVPSEEDFNFGLQGEAFVPAALPQTDGLTLHPMHLQRTAELRAQAAQIRSQQELQNQGAAFPTLQAATAGTEAEAGAGQPPLTIGWASSTTVQRVGGGKKNAGAVTETDFPALQSLGPPKSAATQKLRAPPNQQFSAMRATAVQPMVSSGGGWGVPSRASASATPTPASYQSHAAPTPLFAARANRQEDLAPDNFPALGGGTKKPAYKHAPATRQQQQQVPSWNSTVDFPANKRSEPKRAAGPVKVAPAPKQSVPVLDSPFDFPPPPNASNYNSLKHTVVAAQKKPSAAAMSNVLQVPQSPLLSPANPKDTLQDMQACLGPTKYKKLKNFTQEFANDHIAPDAYIDHAAALFDKGYGDPDFWKTIPGLVSSCPNQASANEALRYMESLRTMTATPTAPVVMAPPAPAPTGGSWGSKPLDLKPENFPTPTVGSARTPPPGWGSGPAIAAAASRNGNGATTRYVVPGAKKNVWGGSAPAAAVLKPATKKTPVSVASAAMNEGPQGGSATKYMANQTKQQAQAAQQQLQPKAVQNSQNKKKKKEKDEVRSLAFGR